MQRGVEKARRRKGRVEAKEKRAKVQEHRQKGGGEGELTPRQHGHHDREAIHDQRENRP